MEYKMRVVKPATIQALQNADAVPGRPVYAAVWPEPDGEYEVVLRLRPQDNNRDGVAVS